MQLHVRVVEAVDIARMDLYKSDPYCLVTYSGTNSTQKTRSIQNTLRPVWNQDFHFNVAQMGFGFLRIVMRDQDVVFDDDMASLDIQLCSLPFGQVVDQWYNMIPMKRARKGGKIHLVVQIAPLNHPPFVPFYSQNNMPQFYQPQAMYPAPQPVPMCPPPPPVYQPPMYQPMPQPMYQPAYNCGSYNCGYRLPPRHPGMSDKTFKKICKAQKKMIKKIF
ncbi:XYPPX repeat family protein [Tritrichomonas foetus]|uniref:XYPPX repeat family protein n=1 Tax=Tritrichomonas foetus TaxID=1144522 RepID=A0A1J4K4D8_9EUKA|nr:XYPPX repeat family protein [Tritrichomonas foetus]|eukprot:OHT05704.1 XYPPX repeat family protein [Tritrichomonas foetus]